MAENLLAKKSRVHLPQIITPMQSFLLFFKLFSQSHVVSIISLPLPVEVTSYTRQRGESLGTLREAELTIVNRGGWL